MIEDAVDDSPFGGSGPVVSITGIGNPPGVVCALSNELDSPLSLFVLEIAGDRRSAGEFLPLGGKGELDDTPVGKDEMDRVSALSRRRASLSEKNATVGVDIDIGI
jgi:hypothetical protein